jgi:hypothetical protein
MARVFVVIIWLCTTVLGPAWAQSANDNKPAPNQPAEVQRKGILEFEFDPEDGAFIFRALDAQGQKALPLTALSVEAIKGTTRTRLELGKPQNGVVRGKTPLSAEEWELVARAELPDGVLQGQYRLGVGQAPSFGRFALVPPNPEVNRLSWLIGLLFGVPVALGILVTLMAAVTGALKPKARV